jgi:putative oxidoreductase
LHDLGKVTNFFTSLGIPAPALSAAFFSGLEFAGGILLAIGLASRLIALPLAIDMIAAYLIADREALFSIVSNPINSTPPRPTRFCLPRSSC